MTPPRLHVITATESPLAVVLRRGPANAVGCFLWDRGTGTLTPGQWLRGRIYEHRSDLSPDGRHLVWFGGTGRPKAGVHGGWYTVVSRAPWLTAIAFLPQDSTWHGGGAFTAPGRVWLNGGGSLPDTGGEIACDPDPRAYPHATDGFHMGDLYVAMMARRGWRHVSGTGYDAVLRKPCGAGAEIELGFALRAPNRALLSNRYTLVLPDGGTRRTDWEWADLWDGRLCYAVAGTLRSAVAAADGTLAQDRLIHDFRDMTFDARPAPYPGFHA